MSKLSDILKQEYSKKGFFTGTASALGKSSLEKLDIRNALFGGSGIGSIMGRKIFGKGYSAVSSKQTPKLRGEKSPTGEVSEVLISKIDAIASVMNAISINAKITAKNSMSLPVIASQMNITQKNIAKLVRLQGETPSKKADSFFTNAKFRENAYESAYGKEKSKTTPIPTKEKPKEKEGGILGFLGSALGSIVKGIGTFVDKITSIGESLIKGIASIASSLTSALGPAVSSIIRLGSSIALFLTTNPIGQLALLTAGIIALRESLKGYVERHFEKQKEEAIEKKDWGSFVQSKRFLYMKDLPGATLAAPGFQERYEKEHMEEWRKEYQEKTGIQAPKMVDGLQRGDTGEVKRPPDERKGHHYRDRRASKNKTQSEENETPSTTPEAQPSAESAVPTTTPTREDVNLGGVDEKGNRTTNINGEIRSGGTISWRNNNPGNIMWGETAKRLGAIGWTMDADHANAVFPTLEKGEEAQKELLKRKGDVSIDTAMRNWVAGPNAPESVRNSPSLNAYVNRVVSASGATGATKISDLSDTQLSNLVAQQRVNEGFKIGTLSTQKDEASDFRKSLDEFNTTARSLLASSTQSAQPTQTPQNQPVGDQSIASIVDETLMDTLIGRMWGATT